MSKITNFEGDNDHVDEEYESSGEKKKSLDRVQDVDSQEEEE